MAWIEVKVIAPLSKVDEVSDLFTTLGALAVTSQDAGDQPLYEPELDTTPHWENNVLTGLFEESSQINAIVNAVKKHVQEATIETHYLKEQEWERAWMKDFHPRQFGKRLWIIPSYQTQDAPEDHVLLDPGLAFGTGKHPTTALCLDWLDENITGNEEVIDYGCGSGILAIAALKLGAIKVFAIDHDPQAILATQENAKKNNLFDEQIAILFPDELREKQADILIANILANPLINLAPKFATLLPAKGKIVLSGILEEQAADVVNAYQPFFHIKHVENLEGWVRIDGTRHPSA